MSIAIRPNQEDFQSAYPPDGKKPVQEEKKNVDGSQLNLGGDKDSEIDAKKNLAQKQAMKLIGDAWNRVQGMMDAKASVEKEKSSKAEDYHELKNKLGDIDRNKEAMREAYGVDKDSQEQKDLELLEKYQDNKNGAFFDSFTEDEIARLKELQGKPLTEYQKNALELNSAKDAVMLELDKKKTELISLTGKITDMKLTLLKSDDVEDALEAAEQIVDAADQEIMGIMLSEGKEHIDEEAEEEQEKHEEAVEKKEELDEKIEATKEKRTEQEELIRGELEAKKLEANASAQKTVDSQMAQAQKSIQKIMDDNHMINEDIKGIEIDLNF